VFDGLLGDEACGGVELGAGRVGSGVGATVGGTGVGTSVAVAVGATATTTTGRRVGVLGGGTVLVGVLVGGRSVGSTAAGTGICSG